jgi:hypothetical protein
MKTDVERNFLTKIENKKKEMDTYMDRVLLISHFVGQGLGIP